MGEWDFTGPHVDDWGFEQDTSHVVWRGEWSRGVATEDEKVRAAQELAKLDIELAVMKLQLNLGDALKAMSDGIKEMTQKFEELGEFLKGLETEEESEDER